MTEADQSKKPKPSKSEQTHRYQSHVQHRHQNTTIFLPLGLTFYTRKTTELPHVSKDQDWGQTGQTSLAPLFPVLFYCCRGQITNRTRTRDVWHVTFNRICIELYAKQEFCNYNMYISSHHNASQTQRLWLLCKNFEANLKTEGRKKNEQNALPTRYQIKLKQKFVFLTSPWPWKWAKIITIIQTIELDSTHCVFKRQGYLKQSKKTWGLRIRRCQGLSQLSPSNTRHSHWS